MRSSRSLLALAAAVACALPAVATATIYDAAADFSPTLNPNGPWSFGYLTTIGGAFNPFVNNGSSGGLDYWQTTVGLPSAHQNPTSGTLTFSTTEHHPGQLTLHPGPNGEYAVARFTAQITGTHTFSVAFVGEDFVYPTTTDVYVLVNGIPIYAALVNAFHGTASSGVFSLGMNPGDTIDAVVGYGTNGNYIGDTTGVNFVVELVPTPSAAALLGLGGLMASGGRRRR